jgi:hypothetical protein
LKENELKEYAKLMTMRFLEDPGVVFQISCLERAELLFSLQCEGQIRAFAKRNAVQVLDGGKGLLIGYSMKELSGEQLLEVFQEASIKLLEKATEDELLLIQEKALLEGAIIPQNWHIKYFDGEVFHLLVVAIDKSAKGTGAFRKLLMPVISDCDNKKMPIVLETFNPANVPIYEHFGFQLMESQTSDKIDLTCFCIIRF